MRRMWIVPDKYQNAKKYPEFNSGYFFYRSIRYVYEERT